MIAIVGMGVSVLGGSYAVIQIVNNAIKLLG